MGVVVCGSTAVLAFSKRPSPVLKDHRGHKDDATLVHGACLHGGLTSLWSGGVGALCKRVISFRFANMVSCDGLFWIFLFLLFNIKMHCVFYAIERKIIS
jgi:hypothetical protein